MSNLENEYNNTLFILSIMSLMSALIQFQSYLKQISWQKASLNFHNLSGKKQSTVQLLLLCRASWSLEKQSIRGVTCRLKTYPYTLVVVFPIAMKILWTVECFWNFLLVSKTVCNENTSQNLLQIRYSFSRITNTWNSHNQACSSFRTCYFIVYHNN